MLHLPLPMRPTIVNVFLVQDGDEWVLIDTGMGSQEVEGQVKRVEDEESIRFIAA
jgi:glyoxylase-like metal-dependent hydrolase (beta-lactamase superfamily II)